jgi:hypothetical protein
MITRIKAFWKRAARLFGVRIMRKPPYAVSTLFRYRVDESLEKRLFTASLLKNIEWEHSDPNFEDIETPIFNIFKKYPNGHKKYSYFELYDKIFSPFQNSDSVKILEIGVYKGNSINMWKEYFGEKATVVGIDINPECTEFEERNRSIFVRIGSQEDTEFLSSIISEFGKFDIIIDDGSHVSSHMIRSFNFLFKNGLNDGGVYFAEDTNTSYWNRYRDQEYSFMDMAKQAVDLLNRHYAIYHYEQYNANNPRREKLLKVPHLTKMIEEIRFFDSVVVFYKSTGKNPPLVKRF